MDRPTRTVQTSGGHSIVLRDYITGGEHWEIRKLYIGGLKKAEGASDGNLEFEADKKAYELVVISVDEQTDNIAQCVLDLPLADFQEVAAAVAEIVEAKKK